MKSAGLLALAFCMAVLSGCGGKKSARVRVPSPPAIEPAPATVPEVGGKPGSGIPEIPAETKPIYVETGIASWYGPPYHNRKGANGEIYDMNQFTAAHRTLPLNSIARVTNLKTGHSVVVRITDRGPFIQGRILDLSLAAAKAIDVWRPGIAMVKLEVLSAPSPLATGGRWCVQVGAFEDKREATQLKTSLMRRYHTAQVLQFTGPTGDWIRVRVLNDDKLRAEEVARDMKRPAEGAIFIVRLD